MKNHLSLLIALILGITFGLALHLFPALTWPGQINSYLLAPLGQIFLRLIFMAVVPLVFCSIVLGVYELSNTQGMGKVARQTLFYTLIASGASVVIGMTLVNVMKPGHGINLQESLHSSQASKLEEITSNALKTKTLPEIIVDLIPKNPLDSAVRALDGEMVALMVFALLFGLALQSVRSSATLSLINVLNGIYEGALAIVKSAMKLAPLAIFAIVFNTAYKQGYEVFVSLFLYVMVVVLGLLLQQFVVYGGLIRYVLKISPLNFFKKCREVYLYSFSTASSNATLPKTLDVAEKELKLPKHIARFVLTVGSTANQNGTALFEGVTVLFLAQVYGIDLSLAQQLQVVIMSILAGIGTAGVPGGSLPLIMILLQQLSIPPEGMGLILGVDRFLDMCRTTINVSGDLVIAALVSKGHPKDQN